MLDNKAQSTKHNISPLKFCRCLLVKMILHCSLLVDMIPHCSLLVDMIPHCTVGKFRGSEGIKILFKLSSKILL